MNNNFQIKKNTKVNIQHSNNYNRKVAKKYMLALNQDGCIDQNGTIPSQMLLEDVARSYSTKIKPKVPNPSAGRCSSLIESKPEQPSAFTIRGVKGKKHTFKLRNRLLDASQNSDFRLKQESSRQSLADLACIEVGVNPNQFHQDSRAAS